jgi:SAM-dependent methyltransferase
VTPGPDWQERITGTTNPAIRIEHELRYRTAAPVIRESRLWCDLGCGNGIAAAAALDEPFAGHVLLVDTSEDALARAEREIPAAGNTALRADLASPEGVGRVRRALLESDVESRGGCITCFEVVEHLTSFVSLVETLAELAERHGFTTVLSVPNDAFWSIENPYHETMWGEGAFDELRRLLPAGYVVARQLALRGSVMTVEGREEIAQRVELGSPTGGVPTHFVVGFGPRAHLLDGGAAVAEANLVEQRRWERQRESDLAYLQALESYLRSELSDWRAYIHELERRLGLPLSGTDEGSVETPR